MIEREELTEEEAQGFLGKTYQGGLKYFRYTDGPDMGIVGETVKGETIIISPFEEMRYHPTITIPQINHEPLKKIGSSKITTFLMYTVYSVLVLLGTGGIVLWVSEIIGGK